MRGTVRAKFRSPNTLIKNRSHIAIQITFCSATNALEMGLRMKMDLDLDPDLPILPIQDEGSQRGVERAAA